MATGGGIALPEPLHNEDSRSWFKRFEVCTAANGWDAAKKLLCLPTLLKGVLGQYSIPWVKTRQILMTT